MSRKVSVIIKRPGESAYHTNISCSLENLQKTVGGYIETVRMFEDATFIVNEEGKLRGFPYNFTISGIDLVGTVILIGCKGNNFCDLPITFKEAKDVFPMMFEKNIL